MTRIRAFAIAIAALGLAACAATPPPFEPQTTRGAAGYSETQIEDDRFRVAYTGRRSDAASIAEDLALLRAADLTLQNGFDWFLVVNRRVSQTSTGSDNPRVSIGVGTSTGSRSGTSVGVGIGVGSGGQVSSSAPEAVLEIIMGRGEKPEDALDAREASINIRAQVLTAP